MHGTPTTYLVGEAFHIAHGWSSCVGTSDDLLANGRLGFALEVDGVARAPSYADISVQRKESTGLPCDVINRSTVFNFPEGLPAGAHTFVGHWTGPCKPLVGDDQYNAVCQSAAQVVEAGFSPRQLTVNFHEPVWNPGRDWLAFPNQANPSPDVHGNPDVWSYLASATLAHDPAMYSSLQGFSDLGGRQQWEAPGFVNLLVGHVTGTTTMVMHSYGGRIVGDTFGRSATLGWTSPIDGAVRIRGRASLPDLSICNVPVLGSIWSIDKGATTFHSAVLPPGGSTTFDLATTVSKGEKLYFVHDPGFDSHCDTLLVDLEIEKT